MGVTASQTVWIVLAGVHNPLKIGHYGFKNLIYLSRHGLYTAGKVRNNNSFFIMGFMNSQTRSENDLIDFFNVDIGLLNLISTKYTIHHEIQKHII